MARVAIIFETEPGKESMRHPSACATWSVAVSLECGHLSLLLRDEFRAAPATVQRRASTAGRAMADKVHRRPVAPGGFTQAPLTSTAVWRGITNSLATTAAQI